MKKLLIGGAGVAAFVGGGFAIATLSPIQLAGAKNTPSVEVQAGQAPGTTQQGQSPGQQAQGRHRGGDGAGRLQQALDELVKDGTLTQDQANKVKDKLQSLMGPGKGRPGFGRPDLQIVAKSIGITPEQLRTELMAGKSIAEVAQAHGVDPQKVINDLVADINAKIDQAVAAGKLPADKAAQIKANLTQRITELVNAKHTGKGPGRGHNGGQGNPTTPTTPGQGGEPAPSTTAPPTTAAPTTAAPTTAPAATGTTGG